MEFNHNVALRIEDAMVAISRGEDTYAIGLLYRLKEDVLSRLGGRPGQENFDQEVALALLSEIDAADKLPPMRPVKSYKSKRMSPNSVINVACPRCGASKGDPCFGFTMAGKNGVPDRSKTIATYHTARTSKAQAARLARAASALPIEGAAYGPKEA